MTRMVVGFDGSPDSLRALRWALENAPHGEGTVTVVHARGLRGDRRAAGDLVPDSVSEMVTDLGVDPSRVHWRVEEGDPCSVLLRACDGPDRADLIVLGTRGHGHHEGLLLGSTSLEVVEHARVPVVVVPEPKSA